MQPHWVCQKINHSTMYRRFRRSCKIEYVQPLAHFVLLCEGTQPTWKLHTETPVTEVIAGARINKTTLVRFNNHSQQMCNSFSLSTGDGTSLFGLGFQICLLKLCLSSVYPMSSTDMSKSQRIGCAIPRCNLERGITQTILRLF